MNSKYKAAAGKQRSTMYQPKASMRIGNGGYGGGYGDQMDMGMRGRQPGGLMMHEGQ